MSKDDNTLNEPEVDFVTLPDEGMINIKFQTDNTGQMDFQIESGLLEPEQIQAVLYGILVAQMQNFVEYSDENSTEEEIEELIRRNSKVNKTLH